MVVAGGKLNALYLTLEVIPRGGTAPVSSDVTGTSIEHGAAASNLTTL